MRGRDRDREAGIDTSLQIFQRITRQILPRAANIFAPSLVLCFRLKLTHPVRVTFPHPTRPTLAVRRACAVLATLCSPTRVSLRGAVCGFQVCPLSTEQLLMDKTRGMLQTRKGQGWIQGLGVDRGWGIQGAGGSRGWGIQGLGSRGWGIQGLGDPGAKVWHQMIRGVQM